MRAFPAGINEAVERYATVVVRTDFSDDQGWDALLDALKQAPEDWDDDEPETFVVDDPSWAGATTDEVLDAVRRHEYLSEYLSVVTIADKEAVSGDEQLLLVVTAVSPDDETYDEVVASGREFRSVPREAHAVTVNVEMANMDFDEFAGTAAESPGGVFRGFTD